MGEGHGVEVSGRVPDAVRLDQPRRILGHSLEVIGVMVEFGSCTVLGTNTRAQLAGHTVRA